METENSKIALVTGSSQGIGFEIARTLGRAGHLVIINGRDPHKLEQALAHLKSEAANFAAAPFDVSDPESVQRGFESIESRFGPVDILVNNAGITRDRSFVKMSHQEWQEVLATNLHGVFYCTKRAVTQMVEKNWGRVISISSIVGQQGAFGQVNYAASKAGILGFTKALAKELSKRGITVNAIAPGYIKTPMTQAMPPPMVDKVKERIPMGDFGKPDDIADMVSFLSSEAGGYITGAVLNIDGGY